MIVRRVLLALAAPGATMALATAADLARAMDADLRGVFVESTELLALATLPFAGEVGFPSPARRALDLESMQRGLRAQARRVERELATVAAGRPLRWSFDVVRSRLTAQLFAEAGDADLAIVALSQAAGASAASPGRALRAFRGVAVPLLLVGERTRKPGTIAVVPPPSFDPAALAEVIAALAPRYGRSVLVIDVAPPSREAEPLPAQIVRVLAQRGLAGRIRRIAHPDVVPALAGIDPSLLVLPPLREDAAAEALVEALGCPVLVLPAARRPAPA